MKIYLAGDPKNLTLMRRVALQLRMEGHVVTLPSEVEDNGKEFYLNTSVSEQEALCDDLMYVAGSADGIALLTGWWLCPKARAAMAAAEARKIHIGQFT